MHNLSRFRQTSERGPAGAVVHVPRPAAPIIVVATGPGLLPRRPELFQHGRAVVQAREVGRPGLGLEVAQDEPEGRLELRVGRLDPHQRTGGERHHRVVPVVQPQDDVARSPGGVERDGPDHRRRTEIVPHLELVAILGPLIAARAVGGGIVVAVMVNGNNVLGHDAVLVPVLGAAAPEQSHGQARQRIADGQAVGLVGRQPLLPQPPDGPLAQMRERQRPRGLDLGAGTDDEVAVRIGRGGPDAVAGHDAGLRGEAGVRSARLPYGLGRGRWWRGRCC